MKYRIPLYLLLSLLLIPLPAGASGKKSIPASVSFHLEGSAVEGPKFVRQFNTLAGLRYFRKAPEVNSKNIVAFSPFPAEDKSSYGLVFKLDKQGTKRLLEATTMNQGKLLLALVNGQPLGVVRIDKPVNDGVLVIWRGITQEEIRMYDRLAPRIGEDPKKWKQRLKEMNKRAD